MPCELRRGGKLLALKHHCKNGIASGNGACSYRRSSMQIRFTSTLTAEDENKIAPAVLNGVARLLELLPIAYVIQIETTDGQVYRSSTVMNAEPADIESGPVRMNRHA